MTDEARKVFVTQIDGGETMAEMWDGFAGLKLSNIAPDRPQYRDMRASFYAGAACLFHWFMVQMDDDREPTDDDLNKVTAMQAEIDEFFLNLMVQPRQ